METVTGQYGVVLLLDPGINRAAKRINRNLNSGNKIDFQNLHTPHLTLYHASFNNLEVSDMTMFLSEVRKALPPLLHFFSIKTYASKFVFWHLNERQNCMDAHVIALLLATYRSFGEISQADKEGLILSEPERKNVQLFGHPLVLDLWQPHITVGYYPDEAGCISETYSQVGKVESVAFAEIGDYGTVKRVICQV